MDDNDVRDVIDIQDPEIDAEAIMRQIREKIHQRRMEAEAHGLDATALAEGQYHTRFDDSLYLQLRQVNATPYARPGVSLAIAQSSGLPLIGPLMYRLRAALHQLAIYYVNMLAAQQGLFNSYVTRTLMTLVKELEKEPPPSHVEELKEEVAHLRAQVEELKARLEQAGK